MQRLQGQRVLRRGATDLLFSLEKALRLRALLRRQLIVELLRKVRRLRRALGLSELTEHPGVDRVGLDAFALREQLREGEVGAVLAAARGGQQLVDGFLGVGVAEVATAIQLAQVVMRGDLRGRGLNQVFFGFLRIGRTSLPS